MNTIYQKVDGSKYRQIFVVGDVHGCYTLLMNKLDSVGFDTEKDLLISVGDLIDRGSESVECLDLINMPWFRAVRGNHEQMMIDGLSGEGNINHWIMNGGDWYFRMDYDQEVLLKSLTGKVNQLPHVLEVTLSGGGKVVVCHAEYPGGQYEYGKPVDSEKVIWNRERVSKAWDGFGFNIDGADLFIFGHTPAKRPYKVCNQLYIDTGAVFCGNLTLHQIQGGDDGQAEEAETENLPPM
ncbi:metallophosphoesterase [Tatumella sp. JGM130]|uniref:metallophosphoesterase n=1 Tax=Tatumella sp. JGM130 TaxID=2799797 RepID=UPI001BAED3FD|nr:metallophosphoesterase [Tatumella sp. JGM130]MBS0895543.1 metallophosphoesterase [Tatumella sp. JGM130]